MNMNLKCQLDRINFLILLRTHCETLECEGSLGLKVQLQVDSRVGQWVAEFENEVEHRKTIH